MAKRMKVKKDLIRYLSRNQVSLQQVIDEIGAENLEDLISGLQWLLFKLEAVEHVIHERDIDTAGHLLYLGVGKACADLNQTLIAAYGGPESLYLGRGLQGFPSAFMNYNWGRYRLCEEHYQKVRHRSMNRLTTSS